MQVDYVLDCGKNGATIHDAAANPIESRADISHLSDDPATQPTVETISHDEVLKLPEDLPRGSTIVCEYAHLGCPRRKRSLAQPFSEDQLLDLYKRFEDNDITLKLFPQQSTPRAVNYAKGILDLPGIKYKKPWVKTDLNDPISLHLFLRDFPDVSLMNPPRSFEPSAKREESYEWKMDSDMYLNILRAGNEKYPIREGDFLSNNMQLIYDTVSETCRSAFGFKLFKVNSNGNKKGDINLKSIKNAQLYAVLVQLLDDEGNPRIRKSTGKLPSWKFIKRYSIKMTPFHFKGGVARSNLYYHGMRNWGAAQMAEELGDKSVKQRRRGGYTKREGNKEYVKGYSPEEDLLFVKYRKQYCDAVRELFRVFKDIIEKDEVQVSIPKVAKDIIGKDGVQTSIPKVADSAV